MTNYVAGVLSKRFMIHMKIENRMSYTIKWFLSICLIFTGFIVFDTKDSEADEAVQDSKKLVAVIPEDFPPTYFKDKKTGEASGLAVDVLNSLAKRIGVEIEYVFDEPWKDIENLVLGGKADLIPFRVMNDKTLRDFIFTHELDATPINYIARSDDPVSTPEISGKIIGVIGGSTADEKLKNRSDIKVIRFDAMQHLLLDLITGQIDLALTVTSNIYKLAEEAGLENRIKVITPPFMEIKRGIALNRKNGLLREKFDRAIEEFHKTREAQIIYEKWLGKPKPWWTARRIGIAALTALGALLIIFMIWRQYTLARFNRMIRYEKDLLRTMIDAIPDLIFYKSRDLNYLGCNRSFAEDFMGRRREDIIGKTDLDLFQDKSIGEYFQKLDTDVMNSGEIDSSKQHITMADGRAIIVETESVPFKDFDGSVIGLIGIARDITEQEKATTEFIKAREAADAANIAKSQFLATMSHEIRTPMNGVIGMINLLLGTGLNNEQKEYAEVVNKSGKNLLRLINDILDFSKVEAGKLELEYSFFNTADMINGIIEVMSLQAYEKNLNISSIIDPGIPDCLKGDEGRLSQILMNMIGNAVKFTEKGDISLHVMMDDETDSTVTLHFKIMDTGIGIAREKIRSVFDPFIQADTTTTRKFGGTGLGLAISKQLVELMGGAVGVDSLENKGSVFWFTVVLEKIISPGAESVKDESTQKHEAHNFDKNKIIILLVEDDNVNQLVTKTFLEKLGYSVEIASNGLEAVEKLEQRDYSLVLMDCLMPEMDGYEATTVIRSQESKVKNHNVPIIALTANALRGDMEKCLASGMDDYLAKPVESRHLKGIIEKWIHT